MGHVTHNAIVVTSWSAQLIKEAVAEAKRLNLTVVGPSEPMVNGYRSFMVVPNGSKIGFGQHDIGNVDRETYRFWLVNQSHEDGSSSLEWCEVLYGSDDKKAKVIYSQWKK